MELAYKEALDMGLSGGEVETFLENEGLSWLDGTAVELGSSLTAASVINDARNAFFIDDDTLEQVDAFEFVNPDPKSEICISLTGTIFAKDDPDMFKYTPPLHWNAVLSEALVTTYEGKKKIKNIKIYDLVLTHKNRYMPVTEVMSKFEDKEYFEIKTNDGKILNITGEHPILTNRGWIPTDQLVLGDDIITIEDIESKKFIF